MNANERRALEAHQRRTVGDGWEEIADDLEFESAQQVRAVVRECAQRLGWDWPIHRPGIPVAGFPSHPEAAYKLRLKGLLWNEVGAKINLHSPNAIGIVMRYARKYAERNDLPWPPKIDVAQRPIPEGGEQAYNLRAERLSWLEVGRRTGLGSKARGRAERYAQITSSPWPIVSMTMAETAYQIKHENPGMPWKTVAKRVGYAHSHHAGTAARRVACAKAAGWMLDFKDGYSDANRLAAEAWEAVGLHASNGLTSVPEPVLQEARNLLGG